MQFDENGRLLFAVAAYNDSDRPANIGLENLEARSPENKTLRIFTVDDLIREARNKAIAASIAIGLLGVAAAAASQTAAHQTYNSTLYTPHGAYHYKASYYDGAQAAAGTVAAIGGASAGIYAVNRSLDSAIAGIGQSMLQTTTVDPGESVAGRVIVQRPPRSKTPQEVAMTVHWNGEAYPFRFQIARADDRSGASNASAQVPAHHEVEGWSAPPAAQTTAAVHSAPAAPTATAAISPVAAQPSSQPTPSVPVVLQAERTAAAVPMPLPAPQPKAASSTPPSTPVAKVAPVSPRAPANVATPPPSPPRPARLAAKPVVAAASAQRPVNSPVEENDEAYNRRMWMEGERSAH